MCRRQDGIYKDFHAGPDPIDKSQFFNTSSAWNVFMDASLIRFFNVSSPYCPKLMRWFYWEAANRGFAGTPTMTHSSKPRFFTSVFLRWCLSVGNAEKMQHLPTSQDKSVRHFCSGVYQILSYVAVSPHCHNAWWDDFCNVVHKVDGFYLFLQRGPQGRWLVLLHSAAALLVLYCSGGVGSRSIPVYNEPHY